MLDHYNMSIHINTAAAQVLVEQRKKNGVISRKKHLAQVFVGVLPDQPRGRRPP